VNYDHAMRLSKRKSISSTNNKNNSVDIAIPLGH
jgi:hypothetical protein